MKEKENQFYQLEDQVKQIVIDNMDWGDVIKNLPVDDQERYWKLAKELQMFSDEYLGELNKEKEGDGEIIKESE